MPAASSHGLGPRSGGGGVQSLPDRLRNRGVKTGSPVLLAASLFAAPRPAGSSRRRRRGERSPSGPTPYDCDPRGGGRRLGADDVRELSPLPPRPGLARFRRGGRARPRQAPCGGARRCGRRATPGGWENPVRALPQLFGWNPISAELAEVSPRRGRSLLSELPVALADYSQDADVTAELVDVGAERALRTTRKVVSAGLSSPTESCLRSPARL